MFYDKPETTMFAYRWELRIATQCLRLNEVNFKASVNGEKEEFVVTTRQRWSQIQKISKNLVTLWVGCGTNRCVGLKIANEWYWDPLFWPRSRQNDWQLLFCTARAARICFLRPTNHITWFMAPSSTLPSLRWQLPALFFYSLPLVSTLPHEAVMRKCFVRVSLHGVVYLVYRVKPAIFDLFLAVGIASYLGLFYLAVMVSLKLIKTLCWRCQPPLKSDSVSRLSGDKINCIITWSKRFTRHLISRWL